MGVYPWEAEDPLGELAVRSKMTSGRSETSHRHWLPEILAPDPSFGAHPLNWQVKWKSGVAKRGGYASWRSLP